MNPVSERIIRVLMAIPPGKVATYAQIARLADCPNGARQVARILHSCSAQYQLPWHRVIKANAMIALAPESGGTEQAARLESEGIEVSRYGKISLEKYAWNPKEKL